MPVQRPPRYHYLPLRTSIEDLPKGSTEGAQLRQLVAKKLQKQNLSIPKNLTRQWLIQKMKDIRITSASIMKDREMLRGRTIIGRFYFFQYDPKTKDKLKYYDKFPIAIPIEMYDNGFLGLNFHYVYPLVRLQLLTKLMQYASNRKMDERTRLRLSYPIIKNVGGLYKATPCIKRYLWDHVRSRFLEIQAPDWKIALSLPVQQFVKEKAPNVWKESEEMAQAKREEGTE